MGCLPDTGLLGVGVLMAPLLLARGLSRRATHWLIIHHQRHLQKLSVKRRHRKSHCLRDRPYSEPLVPSTPEVDSSRLRTVSEPIIFSSSSTTIPTTTTIIVPTPETPNLRTECQGQSSASSSTFLHGKFVRQSHHRLRQELDNQDGNTSASPDAHTQVLQICPYPLAAVGNPCQCQHKQSREDLTWHLSHAEESQASQQLQNQIGQLEGQDVGKRESSESQDEGRDWTDSELRCGCWNVIEADSVKSSDGLLPNPHHLHHLRSDALTSSHTAAHDGRDGNRSSANLQQPSSVGAGSNVTPNRQHSSGLGLKSRSTHPTAPSNINKNRPPAVLPGPPSNIQNKNLSHSSVSNSQDWSQQQVHHPGGQIRLPKQGSGRSSPHLAGVFPPLERAPMIPIEGAGLQNASGGLPIGPERISIGDGESIELTPLYRTLLDRPYFHVISRSKSKKLLENALDGVYLIRPSTRSSDPLTLSLLHNGRIYNINIRRRQDGLYALGKEKVNEVTFSSVDEIVSTYTNEPIKLQSENLQSGKRVTLTNSPAKVDHIYVKMPDNFKKKY